MQVILQGSLRHFGVAALLAFLCRPKEEGGIAGTLDLESSGKRVRVLFQNDIIIWAEGSAAQDPLDLLIAALEWNAGTFTVLDSIVVPAGATTIALTCDELAAEARKRAERAGGYADEATFRVIDDPALQQQISLTSEEFKILFRIAAGKTFRELLAEMTVPRVELAQRITRLEELGLLVVIAAKVEPEPVAPQKRTTAARKRTLVGSLTPDGAPDRVYPLLEVEHTIGRAPENHVAIADGSISSRHARILRTPQGFVVEDLQSRNGTFVNGERVQEKRLLADGDIIRVGRVILIFNLARESKTGDVTQPEVRLAK